MRMDRVSPLSMVFLTLQAASRSSRPEAPSAVQVSRWSGDCCVSEKVKRQPWSPTGVMRRDRPAVWVPEGPYQS